MVESLPVITAPKPTAGVGTYVCGVCGGAKAGMKARRCRACTWKRTRSRTIAQAQVETDALTVDVMTPQTADLPAVWTGGDQPTAPGPLPINTDMILHPLPFNLLAIWHDSLALALIVAGAGSAWWVFKGLATSLPPIPAVLAILVVFGLEILIPLMIAPKRATREMWVILRDESGQTYCDIQRWWHEDARSWADSWRYTIGAGKKGRRVGIIDAQAYDPAKPQTTLFPFRHDLAPLPVRPASLHPDIPFYAPTQPQLGLIYATGRAARSWLDVRDPRQAALHQVAIIIGIGVAILGIYFGGNKTAEMISGEDKLLIQQAVQAEIMREIAAQNATPGPFPYVIPK